MTTRMIYRRFIPPLVPGARAADDAVFALLMLGRLRNKQREKMQQRAELDHWEDEGGSMAARSARNPSCCCATSAEALRAGRAPL